MTPLSNICPEQSDTKQNSTNTKSCLIKFLIQTSSQINFDVPDWNFLATNCSKIKHKLGSFVHIEPQSLFWNKPKCIAPWFITSVESLVCLRTSPFVLCPRIYLVLIVLKSNLSNSGFLIQLKWSNQNLVENLFITQ